MVFGSVATLKAPVQSGKLRAVAVTTLARSAAMPDVPTFVESGVAGFEVNGWYGMLAPSRTPRATIGALNAALRQSLEEAETRTRFAASGLDPLPSSPEGFATLIRNEVAKWAKVVKAAGIKPE